MLNAPVPATAEGMLASMLVLVRDYEVAWDQFVASNINDMHSEYPAVAAAFNDTYEGMTTAFRALLVARPATAQDQSLRALCLLRRIAEDEISADDLAVFLRSML